MPDMLLCQPIAHFTDTLAILNSIVSNIYYGMLRGQICTAMHDYARLWAMHGMIVVT